jgi:hypothetical protein
VVNSWEPVQVRISTGTFRAGTARNLGELPKDLSESTINFLTLESGMNRVIKIVVLVVLPVMWACSVSGQEIRIRVVDARMISES